MSAIFKLFELPSVTGVNTAAKCAIVANNQKRNFDLCGSQSPERISMKLEIHNYVVGVTTHANSCSAATTLVVWPKRVDSRLQG